MEFQHRTVLLHEMIDNVLTDKHGVYIDGTLGGAGHSLEMAKHLAEDALLIGIDQDEEALEVAEKRLKGIPCQYHLVHSNFSKILSVLDALSIEKVCGFMFDLGVSSYQLDKGERGFSYMNDGRLDMRMDRDNPLSAYDVVNTYDEAGLTELIKKYGEERWAKRIAQFIVEARSKGPLETTQQLGQVIKAAIPANARRNGPHPAKRTFQALRIEVNNELGILEQTFRDCVSRLEVGGNIGVITFQSLEDRIVKNTFRELGKGCVCPPELPVCVCGYKPVVRLVGKAIKPSVEEVEQNPRARSAVLRVAEKV